MSLDADRLRASFELVATRKPDITIRFYEILFERYPQAKPLFSRERSAQAKMLAEALMAVLDHLEDAEWLSDTLSGMGRQHEGYGVTREMYPWVGDALISTFAEVAADDWDAETEAAWGAAYGAICELMWTGYSN